MKSLIQIIAALGFSATVTTACQPISGSSLLGDKKELPSGYTVDGTPKEEELYMKATKSQHYATGLYKIEITGECYTSTYSSHYIRVSLGNTVLTNVIDLLNPTLPAGTVRCTNGLFSVSIRSGDLTANANNRVRFQIYANNGAVTNDVQGATQVDIAF